jgi:hypothetical protein
LWRQPLSNWGYPDGPSILIRRNQPQLILIDTGDFPRGRSPLLRPRPAYFEYNCSSVAITSVMPQ